MGQNISVSQDRSDASGGYSFAPDGTFGVQQPNPAQSTSGTKFRHPWAVTFHLGLKVSAIIVYLFGGLFSSEFLALFVILIFLISIDFWVVKNITGRMLAGLRWWNYVDDHGQSHWIFENRAAMPAKQNDSGRGDFVLLDQQQQQGLTATTGGSDATVFWIGLFVFPLFWFFSLISTIFSFNIHWVLLVAIALVLSGSNLYGYLRCRFGTNYSYGSVLNQYINPGMMFNMFVRSAVAANSQQHQSPPPTTTSA